MNTPPDHSMLDRIADADLWKAIASVFAAMFLGLVGLVKVIYNRDRKAINFLYKWKDDVVDPHIAKLPLDYVRAPYCNKKHDEISAATEKRHDEMIAEMRHIRGILEKHLINGSAGK